MNSSGKNVFVAKNLCKAQIEACGADVNSEKFRFLKNRTMRRRRGGDRRTFAQLKHLKQ